MDPMILHRHCRDGGNEGGERQRHVRTQEEHERRKGSGRVHERLGQIVREQEFQVLHVVGEHRLDLARAAVVHLAERRLGEAVEDTAAHVEQRPVGALVRQGPREAEQDEPQDDAHREDGRIGGDHREGAGPLVHGAHDVEDRKIGYGHQKPRHRRADDRGDEVLPMSSRPLEHEGDGIGILLPFRVFLLFLFHRTLLIRTSGRPSSPSPCRSALPPTPAALPCRHREARRIRRRWPRVPDRA